MTKKTITSLVIAGLITAGLLIGTVVTSDEAEAAPDPVAAILLSAALPGVGEWYNSGFSGGFPLVECILGNVCPCVHLASVIDGAAGKTDDGLRFDFWSSPN